MSELASFEYWTQPRQMKRKVLTNISMGPSDISEIIKKGMSKTANLDDIMDALTVITNIKTKL